MTLARDRAMLFPASPAPWAEARSLSIGARSWWPGRSQVLLISRNDAPAGHGLIDEMTRANPLLSSVSRRRNVGGAPGWASGRPSPSGEARRPPPSGFARRPARPRPRSGRRPRSGSRPADRPALLWKPSRPLPCPSPSRGVARSRAEVWASAPGRHHSRRGNREGNPRRGTTGAFTVSKLAT